MNKFFISAIAIAAAVLADDAFAQRKRTHDNSTRAGRRDRGAPEVPVALPAPIPAPTAPVAAAPVPAPAGPTIIVIQNPTTENTAEDAPLMPLTKLPLDLAAEKSDGEPKLEVDEVQVEFIGDAEVAEAEAVVNSELEEIRTRYASTRESAAEACGGLPAAMEKLKVLAGISTATAGATTLAAGAATASGFTEKAAGFIGDEEKAQGMRTATALTAAGTSGATAALGFIGAKELDKIMDDVKACNDRVGDIRNERSKLIAALPDGQAETDQTSQDMANIMGKCRGFDLNALESIKKRFTASGVVSAVGAGTGVISGVTSIIAKNGDTGTKSGGLNITSNIAAAVTTATGATSTILSITLINDLKKNADTADSCASAF